MSEMYNDYDVKEVESTENIRKKNKEYLESITTEERIKNEKIVEEKMKDLFNIKKSFLVDFAGYFAIILLGILVNTVLLTADMNSIMRLILSGIMTLVLCSMLYYLGYIRAKNKKGVKKYSPIVCILLLYIFTLILSPLFGIFGHDFILAKVFRYISNLFVYSHKIIFMWLAWSYEFVIIPYIEVLITLLFMTLGIRHSIIKEKNSK